MALPAAAAIAFQHFVRPALLRFMGHSRVLQPLWRVILREDAPNGSDRTRLRRVAATPSPEGWEVTSARSQGSSVLRSLAAADGIVLIQPGPGHRAADVFPLLFFRDPLVEETEWPERAEGPW